MRQKRSLTKRILSLVMTVAVVFSYCAAVPVYAEEDGGQQGLLEGDLIDGDNQGGGNDSGDGDNKSAGENGTPTDLQRRDMRALGTTHEADISKGSVAVTATAITYTDTDDTPHTGDPFDPSSDRIVITGSTSANTITVDGVENVDITLDGVQIDVAYGGIDNCAFALTNGASVNLTLSGDNTLKSGANRAGLEVPSGTAVTIDADSGETDTLTAASNRYGAGIGGGGSEAGPADSGGDITIYDGTITAYSLYQATNLSTDSVRYSVYGAGIGGGGSQDGAAGSGGTITISGGAVTASSIVSGQFGSYYADNGNGAGIGGGGSRNSTAGSGGVITINGGTINAYAASKASGVGAGIGGGGSERGTAGTGGKISISDGTINAYSLLDLSFGYGAGIGGGGGGGVDGGSGGEIEISGGDVTAYSGSQNSEGYGAGIGGGGSGKDDCSGGSGGKITISDGNITAGSCNYTSSGRYGSGAGIGGGGNAAERGTGGDGGEITITGGNISAHSSKYTIGYGAGIGGGGGFENTMVGGGAGQIAISGGTIVAYATTALKFDDGRGGDGTRYGIGGGRNAEYLNNSVKITGGSVSAKILSTDTAMSIESPKNGSSTALYSLTATLAGITSATAITDPPVSGYGMNDVYTDTSGNLYFWLPADTYSNLSFTSGSTTYSGSAVVDNSNESTAILPNYTATMTVKKDGQTWSNHGKTYKLYKDNTAKHTGSNSQGTVTFIGVQAGTYDVYDATSSTPVDTGVDFTVSAQSTTLTLNYYTVAFALATPLHALAGNSSISATYGGSNNGISNGAVVIGGKELVITATGSGTGTAFTYAWAGAGTNSETTAALTISSLGGAVNATCTVTGFVVPAAPTGLTATAGNGQVVLSWTAPSGSTITGYEYSKDGGTWTATGSTSTSATVTGLTNGTQYSFKVRAVNVAGGGTATDSAAATPYTVPAAPTGLSAVAGNRQVQLSWTAPSNGGSAITGYKYSADGGSTWTETSSTETSATVTSLTNGTEYTFKVRAVNAAGDGAVSGSATATPLAVPGAPTGLTATAGNGAVALAWTAPSDIGGSAITGYKYSVDGGTTWTATGGTSASMTVTGLTNGTEYTFKVRAVNAVGDGSVSDSATATPRTIPTAPTGLSATAGNGQVDLTWTAPTDNGGSAITGYKYSVDGGTTWTATGGTSTSMTVTGLTNGTEYTFKVRAVNAVGDGSVSDSATATPCTIPTAPTDLSATSGNGQVVLAWTAPSDSGGSAITGYKYSADGGSTWTATGNTSTTATVTGLTNGTQYTFKVCAVNAVGDGAASDSISATPRTVSAPPTDLSATSENGQVVLTWTAPSDNGGSDITGYEYSTDGGITWESTGDTATSVTVDGLESNTSYEFKVRSVNEIGIGDESDGILLLTQSEILVSASPENGGAVSGAGFANIGDNHKVSATANSDYSFTRWEDGKGASLSTNAEYSFAVEGNISLTAIFTKKANNGGGGGSGGNLGGGGNSGGTSGTDTSKTDTDTSKTDDGNKTVANDVNIVQLPTAEKTLQEEIIEGKQPSIVLDKDEIGSQIDKDLLETGSNAGFDYVDIHNNNVTLSVPTSIKDSLNSETGDVLVAVITPKEKELPPATKDRLEKASPINEKLLKETFDIELSGNNGGIKITEPLKVTIDISNVPPEDWDMLTGFITAEDGSYKQLGGEVSEDGTSFTFYTYDQGIHGIAVTDELLKIRFTVDENEYEKNKTPLMNDVAPFISEESRTMVPIRAVSEALDCKVEWDAETQTVTIIKDDKVLEMTIGEELPDAMGEAVITSGRTFVPVRYVSEMLDANVVWDKETKDISIYS